MNENYYWNNALLKERAKGRLRQNWGGYLLIGALVMLLNEAVGLVCGFMGLTSPSEVLEWAYIQSLRPTMEEMLAMLPAGDLMAEAYRELLSLTLTARQILAGLAQGAVQLVLGILFYNLLLVGQYRWLMEARQTKPGISTLFSVFASPDQWLGVAWVRLNVAVRTFLWSLLFAIPGIVYGYKTVMVPWLLAENPYMTTKRAIQLSKAMTNGEKMRIFILQLSFFGWALLVGLISSLANTIAPVLSTLIILAGSVALGAYMDATMAELYACMREKAFRMGWTDSRELAGFAA